MLVTMSPLSASAVSPNFFNAARLLMASFKSNSKERYQYDQRNLRNAGRTKAIHVCRLWSWHHQSFTCLATYYK